MRRFAGPIVLTALLLSPAFAAAPEAELAAQDQAFVAAFNAKDAAAMAALYAEDAISMDPGPAMWHKGRAAIREGLVEMVAAPGKAKLAIHDTSYRVVGTLGYASGLWKMTIEDPSGAAPTVLEGRFSSVSEKRGGKWVYVLDHASMPTPAAE